MMNGKHLLKQLGNSWLYFRTGFNAYITLPLSAFETLLIIWYLPAVKDSWIIQGVFQGNLAMFIVFSIIVGIPVAIGFGKFHWIKWAYQSEMDVNVRGNQYNYKFTPGYTKEALGPYYELTLTMLLTIIKGGTVTPDDEHKVAELLRKFQVLNEGGAIGRTDANI